MDTDIKVSHPIHVNVDHGQVAITECVCDTCGLRWSSVICKTGARRRRTDMREGDLLRTFFVTRYRFCSLECAKLSKIPIVQERVKSASTPRGA